MIAVNVFYQGEGLREIEHLEVSEEQALSALKSLLIQRHGLPAEFLIFLEDGDEPLDQTLPVRECSSSGSVKLHLHRCRHVEVAVSFNGKTVEHRFAPAATIARVKRWAAEKQFGMSRDEATEHVLQIGRAHV